MKKGRLKMGIDKELKIRCLCQADSVLLQHSDGVLMQFDASQDAFFCPICGNHLIHEVLEDIVVPSLKHLKQAKCVLLPALKNQILITKS
jgi:hypothetical protein